MESLLPYISWLWTAPETAPENVSLAMAWFIPMLAMAAAGALKGMSDQQIESKQRKIQGATTRYSPWTGMRAADPKPANMLGDIMSGAASGLAMGQGMEDAPSWLGGKKGIDWSLYNEGMGSGMGLVNAPKLSDWWYMDRLLGRS